MSGIGKCKEANAREVGNKNKLKQTKLGLRKEKGGWGGSVVFSPNYLQFIFFLKFYILNLLILQVR